MSTYSETRRQVVHVAMAGVAVLLRYLTWPQAAALALSAVLFNVFVLARGAPEIIRKTDSRGARAGVLFYPLSVLTLILMFPNRLDIVAAAWGVLAFGDGFATIGGQAIGGPRLPWNTDKTWSGLCAFVVAGGAGAVALSAWVAPSLDPLPPAAFTLWAPIAATVVAAFVETVPIGLDDNLSVPAAAAGTLWFASQLNWIGPVDTLVLDLLAGLALITPLAFVARRAGSVTSGGALVGILFGSVIYAGFFLTGIAVLGLAFAFTIVSSRAGHTRKAAIGDHGERRGAGNIIANCVVATLGAVLELFNFTWGMELTAAWFVGGIAAGASDTVASEIGKAFGGEPRSFPTWRRVAAGTPGAVSICGHAGWCPRRRRDGFAGRRDVADSVVLRRTDRARVHGRCLRRERTGDQTGRRWRAGQQHVEFHQHRCRRRNHCVVVLVSKLPPFFEPRDGQAGSPGARVPWSQRQRQRLLQRNKSETMGDAL